MDFVSIRIITSDVARLVEFYERATGVQASVGHRRLRRTEDCWRNPRDRGHPHRPLFARALPGPRTTRA